MFANTRVQNFAAIEFSKETTFFFAKTNEGFLLFVYPFRSKTRFATVCLAVSRQGRKHGFRLGFANVFEVVEHGALFVLNLCIQ